MLDWDGVHYLSMEGTMEMYYFDPPQERPDCQVHFDTPMVPQTTWALLGRALALGCVSIKTNQKVVLSPNRALAVGIGPLAEDTVTAKIRVKYTEMEKIDCLRAQR